jgi:hypothetical protein
VIVKVCRDCGEEFRPEIGTCSDCGGELEVREVDVGTPPSWPKPAQAEEPDLQPSGDYVPFLVAGAAPELRPYADSLLAAGVPFYLRPREGTDGRPGSGYEIRLRALDREQAVEALDALLREEGGAILVEVHEELGADAEEEAGGGAPACPACGATVPSRARACLECGLVFVVSGGE